MDDFKSLSLELLKELEKWTGREVAKDLKKRAHEALTLAKTEPLVEALQWIAIVNATESEYQEKAKNALEEWRNSIE